MIRCGSMSDMSDRPARRGMALLLAIATCTVVGLCVLALWHANTATARAIALESAIGSAESLADSARILSIRAVVFGAWRTLADPGTSQRVARAITPQRASSADIGRVGWSTLVVRGTGDVRTGVPGIAAHADTRTIIPLRAPIETPSAALIGVQPWSVAPSAIVDIPTATGRELRCRPASAIATTMRAPYPTTLELRRIPIVDPDTLRDSLTGVWQLSRARLARPLIVRGLVVIDQDLEIGADLRIVGVLISHGSIRPAGGHLDVTGAVVSGDVTGGASVLGAGDRVRYDACAIRNAVERATSPAPTAAWTTLRVF